MVTLALPDVQFEAGYRAAFEEFCAEGRADVLAQPPDDRFQELVDQLRQRAGGRGLPEGWVSGSTYWVVDDDDEFVGQLEIRHRLSEALRRFGGNVGYSIRPTRRRRGYGTAALRLALPKCLELGLERVLVTCDTTNEGSRRIIVANGGELEDVELLPHRTVPTMRFWIDVERQCRDGS